LIKFYRLFNVTGMINLRISDELKRRLSISYMNVSSAHQAMLWTKRVNCQQM